MPMLYFIIAIILLLPGMAMAVIPGIPGLLYMLGIAAVFGLLDHFTRLTPENLAILAAIAFAAMLLDLISGIAGAKWGGAHWSSLIYGVIGLVAGAFIIPIPIIGSVVGLFIGILGAEWYRTASIKKANKAALGSFAGSMVGMVGNGAAAVAILTLFIVFAWS